MEEAERHCDRLGVIDRGRLVEQGEPGELIERHGVETPRRGLHGRHRAPRSTSEARKKGGSPMSAPSAASPAASAEPTTRSRRRSRRRPLGRVAAGTIAMAQAEMRKLRHDHLDIVTRSVQPLLWLFIFGTALGNTAARSRSARSNTAPTSPRA